MGGTVAAALAGTATGGEQKVPGTLPPRGRGAPADQANPVGDQAVETALCTTNSAQIKGFKQKVTEEKKGATKGG